MYGLEVCRGLDMDTEFLDTAVALRKAMFTADGKERAVRDYHASNTDIATLHNAAKKYSDRTELVFKQLQIIHLEFNIKTL